MIKFILWIFFIHKILKFIWKSLTCMYRKIVQCIIWYKNLMFLWLYMCCFYTVFYSYTYSLKYLNICLLKKIIVQFIVFVQLQRILMVRYQTIWSVSFHFMVFLVVSDYFTHMNKFEKAFVIKLISLFTGYALTTSFNISCDGWTSGYTSDGSFKYPLFYNYNASIFQRIGDETYGFSTVLYSGCEYSLFNLRK